MTTSEKLSVEEAEFLLRWLIDDHQRRMHLLLAPYVNELAHLEARKPPRPVLMPDGRQMFYVGPTAEDIGGPYQAPNWLRALPREHMDVAAVLRRFRSRHGLPNQGAESAKPFPDEPVSD